MSEELLRGLAEVRDRLLDSDGLVRAVATGKRRGTATRWRRIELRYVDLRAGRHLQVSAYDDTKAYIANHPVGESAQALDDALAEPFGSWHVETTTETLRLRVTRKGEVLLHTAARQDPPAVDRSHDRDKQRLLAEDDPVFRALGLADGDGRLKPSRRAKHRQVEEFLRLLDAAVSDAIAKGRLRMPTTEEPLRVVDLGCGNAYLMFAAHRYLTGVRGLPIALVGVDVKEQSREHNEALAAELGIAAGFVVATITDAVLDPAPEVVLALHACDTATDEALARAVAWRSPLVLAAPCCHHDIAAQLRRAATPAPYDMLTKHGILRERLADTLTDGLRASLMVMNGYRTDVVQFVESRHTPRNTLLRATRITPPPDGGSARRDYEDLVTAWGIRPRLADLLDARADPHGAG